MFVQHAPLAGCARKAEAETKCVALNPFLEERWWGWQPCGSDEPVCGLGGLRIELGPWNGR